MTKLIEPKLIHITMLEDTPIGSIGLARSTNGLIAFEFIENISDLVKIIHKRYKGIKVIIDDTTDTDTILNNAQNQLIEYLNGTRNEFALPIDWSVMRPFQEKVLKATSQIPYGKTRTYGEIASQIGSPQSARAVGRIEATNPLPIIIPCHRVIGADGSLRGYGGGGGIETKVLLLQLERSMSI